MKRRFEVWSFRHPEAMKQFAEDNDYDIDMFMNLISHNTYMPLVEYGQNEGSYDSENLALDRASHIANRSTICRIFVWDNVEKIWL